MILDEMDTKIQEFDMSCEGKITSSEIKKAEFDDEFSDFSIKYEYKYNGKDYSGKDRFVLNTDHVGWANRGGLLNFPKARFNEEDIFNLFKIGKPIKIHFSSKNPEKHRVEYDKIVYQASEF